LSSVIVVRCSPAGERRVLAREEGQLGLQRGEPVRLATAVAQGVGEEAHERRGGRERQGVPALAERRGAKGHERGAEAQEERAHGVAVPVSRASARRASACRLGRGGPGKPASSASWSFSVAARLESAISSPRSVG
jgi:hypothetical protein